MGDFIIISILAITQLLFQSQSQFVSVSVPEHAFQRSSTVIAMHHWKNEMKREEAEDV